MHARAPQLQEIEGDEYRGVGEGQGRADHRAVQGQGHVRREGRRRPTGPCCEAEGRDTRGQGNATATITALLDADGDGTHVTVTTDLTVTGKVAQFGRGVLADVSAKLLEQFVDCLEATVLADERCVHRRAPSEVDRGRRQLRRRTAAIRRVRRVAASSGVRPRRRPVRRHGGYGEPSRRRNSSSSDGGEPADRAANRRSGGSSSAPAAARRPARRGRRPVAKRLRRRGRRLLAVLFVLRRAPPPPASTRRSTPQPATVIGWPPCSGASPQGEFEVVVRDADGRPGGDPQRARCSTTARRCRPATGWSARAPMRPSSRLEADGGVRRAEAEVDAAAIAAAHDRYAAERDAALPADHDGPAPVGGVGGTRDGREVPARPLRLVPGRRRRPGRAVGRRRNCRRSEPSERSSGR